MVVIVTANEARDLCKQATTSKKKRFDEENIKYVETSGDKKDDDTFL